MIGHAVIHVARARRTTLCTLLWANLLRQPECLYWLLGDCSIKKKYHIHRRWLINNYFLRSRKKPSLSSYRNLTHVETLPEVIQTSLECLFVDDVVRLSSGFIPRHRHQWPRCHVLQCLICGCVSLGQVESLVIVTTISIPNASLIFKKKGKSFSEQRKMFSCLIFSFLKINFFIINKGEKKVFFSR